MVDTVNPGCFRFLGFWQIVNSVMLRATRRFIRDRQPHTDFVVGTVPVQPHPRLEPHCYDIQYSVGQRVSQDQDLRAVIGWRVYGYDAEAGETRFEPWWWMVDQHQRAWDIDPNPAVQEYIMDQALVVYRREQFLSRASVLPPDLYLHQDQWQFAVAGSRWPLAQLDRENLTCQDRDSHIHYVIIAQT